MNSSSDRIYISPQDRELQENPDFQSYLELTPFNVQTIVYELMKNHFRMNDPKKQGFKFDQKYTDDPNTTGILIDMAYNYNAKEANKRPAVYITRGDAQYTHLVFNDTVRADTKESIKEKLVLVTMDVGVAVVATNVGFCERLAEFAKQPLLEYAEQIRCDFKLRKFSVTSTSKPTPYPEAKDHFYSVISIQTAFDHHMVIRGDDLKIQSVSRTIFPHLACPTPFVKPMEKQ